MISPERYARLDALLVAALDLPPEQRIAFLDTVCPDTSVRQELESLIAASERQSLLDRPARLGETPSTEGLGSVRPMLTRNLELGPYVIGEQLGQGGMGEVYRARDRRLGRDVAIKVVSAHLINQSDALARFETEARAIAALSHPNILAIHDVGSANGLAYAVMELLEGESLRQILARGSVGVRRALDYALQVARGLAAAHDKGIVHRDLKPENVIVTTAGVVKILDFGLAKLGPAHGETQIGQAVHTGTGVILGTVGYMAPEQVRGEIADVRADLFAFGAMLYELLSGRHAFQRDTAAETMVAVLREDPEPLNVTDLPHALAVIVSHCLEKQQLHRFQSARDLVFALEMLPLSSGSRITSALPPLSDRRRKNRNASLIVIAAVVTLAVGYALAGFSARATVDPDHIVKQLTFDSGMEAFPKLSPDGTLLVYAGTPAGNSDIFLRDVGGRSAINLTGDSPVDDRHPALSPDGQQIAYRSERDGGGIFLIGRMGGVPRRVTANGFNPAWSPDAKQLVLATEATDATPESRSGIQSQLLIADIVTGVTRTLRTEDAVEPAWSPHGLRIAYWGLWQRNQRDIWTVGVDGSEPVRVTNDAAMDWTPTWSPDGLWLYFCSDRGGSMNLWRVGIDEGSGTVRDAPEAVKLPASWVGHVSIGHDGRVVYASFDKSANVDRVPFDPSGVRFTGPPESLTTGSNYFINPQVSHDGRSLTFLGQTGSGRNVFVSSGDGRDVQQITTGPWREAGVYWSPDDRRIAFYSARSGRYQIYTVNRDGSELRQVSDVPGYGVGRAVWSHNGRWFATYEPVTLVPYLVDAGKAEPDATPQALPKPPDGSGFVPSAWYHDDQWILGDRTRGGVWLYSVRDRTYRQLSERGGGGPRWIGNSRRALFSDGDDFFVVDVDSGAIRSIGRPDDDVVRSNTNARPVMTWSLSWDGQWLYRSRIRLESDLWLMQSER